MTVEYKRSAVAEQLLCKVDAVQLRNRGFPMSNFWSISFILCYKIVLMLHNVLQLSATA